MPDKLYNRTLGILRLVAVYALVALLALLSTPSPAGVTLGFSIATIGEAIRFWAAGHLQKNVELITSGPYLYTRNPLYLGRLLIFSGLCIMASLPYHANYAILVLGYSIFFGYYLPKKERLEPARLGQAHGEAYDRYHRSVPALFPSLRPYQAGGGQGWSSDRMLRNREHWMVIGLVLVSLYLLWRAYTPSA